MTIVFVGIPGAGKSSVGECFAQKLGLSFVDVDQRIEEVLGKPIAEVFADEGEAYFRAAEEEATLELLDAFDVVSLGGGAVMNERIRAALVGHEVIWLQASIGKASRRIGMNRTRPLMLGNVRGTLIKLMRERTPYYEQVASQSIDTDELTSDEVCQALVEARE